MVKMMVLGWQKGLEGAVLAKKPPGASFVTTAFAWRLSFLHLVWTPVCSSL